MNLSGYVTSILKVVAVMYEMVSPVLSTLRPAGSEPSTFTAAVYEHRPFLPMGGDHIYSRKEALELMRKNLDVYEDQTRKAKQQGAQILVFPEDGIYGMMLKEKKAIFPFMEKIPDPKVIQWSPCNDPTLYQDSEVQHALSCMAKENDLYVVANMGDIVPCNTTIDPKCPPSGHYQYNTDVAFDPQGRLVAKYHKKHLYYEPQFDVPEPEVVYFDTPFGRFGMLVCFDALFENPAVTMVTEHNVSNILFPTAWMDALPLLSAIGYHSSFARGLRVNFLSANIHLPKHRFQGSGIYTPNGMASFYYNRDPLSPGKLLVSTIDIIKHNSTRKAEVSEIEQVDKISNDFNKTGSEFKAEMFKDVYNFKLLEDQSGNLSVCQKNVCCSMTYSLADDAPTNKELFAFGVFDGLHTSGPYTYYLQMCAVVKCQNDLDAKSCGDYTMVSNTKFKHLSMSGQFQTEFVYPQILMSKNGQLVLGDKQSWSFEDTTMTSEHGLDQPLITAALIGRHYCRDDGLSKCSK